MCCAQFPEAVSAINKYARENALKLTGHGVRVTSTPEIYGAKLFAQSVPGYCLFTRQIWRGAGRARIFSLAVRCVFWRINLFSRAKDKSRSSYIREVFRIYSAAARKSPAAAISSGIPSARINPSSSLDFVREKRHEGSRWVKETEPESIWIHYRGDLSCDSFSLRRNDASTFVKSCRYLSPRVSAVLYFNTVNPGYI